MIPTVCNVYMAYGGWRDLYDSIAPKPRIFSSGPRTKKSEVEWAILSYRARQPPIFAIYAPPQDTYHIFKLNKMQHAENTIASVSKNLKISKVISTLVFALKSNCSQIDDRIYLSFNMGLLSKNLQISKVI